LLIDRQLGELSTEAGELLDAWLAEHPQAAADAPSLQRAAELTRAAVRRFPELARPEVANRGPTVRAPYRRAEPTIAPGLDEPSPLRLPSGPRFRWLPLAMAASLVLVLSISAWLGFRAGEESAQRLAKQNNPAPAANAVRNKPAGPWARYALATDARGGLTVVRREANSQP
jgi:hypothetical protein